MPPALILSQDQTLHCKKAAAAHRSAPQRCFSKDSRNPYTDPPGPPSAALPRRAVLPAAARSTGFSDLQVHRTVQFSKSPPEPTGFPGLPSHRVFSLPRPAQLASRFGAFLPELDPTPCGVRTNPRADYSTLPQDPEQPGAETSSRAAGPASGALRELIK